MEKQAANKLKGALQASGLAHATPKPNHEAIALEALAAWNAETLKEALNSVPRHLERVPTLRHLEHAHANLPSALILDHQTGRPTPCVDDT